MKSNLFSATFGCNLNFEKMKLESANNQSEPANNQSELFQEAKQLVQERLTHEHTDAVASILQRAHDANVDFAAKES